MNKDTDIEVKVFTIHELKNWIYKGTNVGLTDCIISNARALALINNPYAQDSFPAIAVAYDEQRNAVGYTAAMADKIDGELVFYGTSGFIDASMRGKGLGTRIYSAMMDACNNRWLSIDQSLAALAISKKRGLRISYFDRYYLNFSHTSSLKSLVRTWWMRSKNRRALRHLPSQTRLEILRYIDDCTYSFILQHSENMLFHRSQEIFNWILQNPFKACAPADLASYSKYEFTTALPQYIIYAFRILLKEKLIGFAMFRLNMRKLTLLYLYKDETYIHDVYAALVKHILYQDIELFTTFDKGLMDYFDSSGAVSMNAHSRTIRVSFSVPADMPFDTSLTLQGGDGDMFC